MLRFFIHPTKQATILNALRKIENVMLMLILISVFLLAVCFLALGVKIFFHHSHKFPETSAGHSPALRKCGIRCPHAEEEEAKNDCSACTD